MYQCIEWRTLETEKISFSLFKGNVMYMQINKKI